MPDFKLDVVCGSDPPKFPKRSSDDWVHGFAGVDDYDCGPVVTKDGNRGSSEGREPQSSSYEEIPTLKVGDGKAQILEVVWVEELVKLKS